MRSKIYWIALALAGLSAGALAQVGPNVQPTSGGMDKAGRIEPTVGDAGIAMCFGDGTGAMCKHRHQGDLGRGCENSLRTGGARLVADGMPRVSEDSVTFHVDGLPISTTVMYFQGTKAALGGFGYPFGDGIMCVSGSIRRLEVKRGNNGFSAYPGPFDPSISVVGNVSVRDPIRYYQVMYRDAGWMGTHTTFNLTNAWMVHWIP
jgi:hypothetical protein